MPNVSVYVSEKLCLMSFIRIIHIYNKEKCYSEKRLNLFSALNR